MRDKKKISLIAAISANQVIGQNNQLPWHLPDDLRFFKTTTLGKTVLMGRKCYESIGRALPQRTNIVLSRQPHFSAEGVLVAHSLEEALQMSPPEAELVVIGGAEIYQLCLPWVQTLYVTHVHAHVAGNVFFPALNWTAWQEQHRLHHPADDKHAFAFDIVTYERLPAHDDR